MSPFEVKTPPRNAVVTGNFKYNSSQDICSMPQAKFKGEIQKKYLVLDL